MGDVSIAQAKAHLSALVERVERGESVTLTKRGRPVARIVPFGAPPLKPKMDMAKLDRLRASTPPVSESIVSVIRRMRDGDIDE